MQENVSTSFIPRTSDSGNHNSQNPNSNQLVNKELEKQLQNLKIEYHNNKHKLKNLNETLKNLKSRADIEKKGPEGVSHSNCKLNFYNCSYGESDCKGGKTDKKEHCFNIICS
jgi:hypothetical protein